MPTEPSVLATRHGKLLLALLCAVAFLDVVDASIVNIALPSIRADLHFSEAGLQWVPGGYLLTYGGLLMLGGRLADVAGRRRVLAAGTLLIGVASLVGGLSGSSGLLVGARLAQGVGAALMLPAALSLLTTTFRTAGDRNTAFGVWGGVGGLASAAGVLFGGLLTQGPGWRWVFFVNPVACVPVLVATFRLIAPDGPVRRARLDLRGAALATGGLLLLVYALVEAPGRGWSSVATVGCLVGALVLLAGFVVSEAREREPLLPLSIFRSRGLAAADATQLVAFAAFLSMFFVLTLYMENVLGWSALRTGVAYLPLCGLTAVSAGVCSQLLARVGTRPLIVGGLLAAAAGVFLLSRVPVHGTFAADVLPGTLVVAVGLGSVFVAVTAAANAGVPPSRAGLAAALLATSQQVGGALGLAVLTSVATARTDHLLRTGASQASALTGGFRDALLAGSIALLVTALIATRVRQVRSDPALAAGPVVGESAPSPARLRS